MGIENANFKQSFANKGSWDSEKDFSLETIEKDGEFIMRLRPNCSFSLFLPLSIKFFPTTGQFICGKSSVFMIFSHDFMLSRIALFFH